MISIGEWFQNNTHQGWVLPIMTSMMCIMGCLMITIDYLYQICLPSLANKYPFQIQQNSSFMIASLSLSAGSLIFTSMYNLLPEAKEYFDKIDNNNTTTANGSNGLFYLLGSYLLGIVICGGLNALIHFCTSESVVHCVHEDEEHGHHHGSGHGPGHHDDVGDHDHHSSASVQALPPSESDTTTSNHNNENEPITETTALIQAPPQPLPRPGISKKNSLIDLSLQKLGLVYHSDHSHRHSHNSSHEDLGQCYGYESIEKCVILHRNVTNNHHRANTNTKHGHGHHDDKSLIQGSSSSSSSSTAGGGGGGVTTVHDQTTETEIESDQPIVATTAEIRELHYCELPSTENYLFFKQQQEQKKNQDPTIHQEFVIQSPLLGNVLKHKNDKNKNNNNVREVVAGHTQDQAHGHGHSHSHGHGHGDDEETHNHNAKANDDDDNEESHPHDHHHHHITTPLSRLLSIGSQTILAITLHKFPEGFIMYSTSKANPSLGLTIFLSLAIHNFVEGFTMCLPLYLALQSRWKAILISSVLGGLAQPFGAMLAWLFFKNKSLDKPSNSLNFLFGNLMALTAGFLTIIGFQMFASAISFGGSQRFVLIWMSIGIALIGFSYILIGE